jgi:hypothetical protein
MSDMDYGIVGLFRLLLTHAMPTIKKASPGSSCRNDAFVGMFV